MHVLDCFHYIFKAKTFSGSMPVLPDVEVERLVSEEGLQDIGLVGEQVDQAADEGKNSSRHHYHGEKGLVEGESIWTYY